MISKKSVAVLHFLTVEFVQKNSKRSPLLLRFLPPCVEWLVPKNSSPISYVFHVVGAPPIDAGFESLHPKYVMASIEKDAPVPAPATGPAPGSSSSDRKDLTSEKRYDVDIESQEDHVGKLQGGAPGNLKPGEGDIEDESTRRITMKEIWEKRSFSLFYRRFRVQFHIAYAVAMTASVFPVLHSGESNVADLLYTDGGSTAQSSTSALTTDGLFQPWSTLPS